jgi:hypothetical protein
MEACSVLQRLRAVPNAIGRRAARLGRTIVRFTVIAAVLGALFMALDVLFLPDEDKEPRGE